MGTPVCVLLVGAAGRMGQAISRAAETQSDIEITGRVDFGDAIEPPLDGCDVAIDFSHADATANACAACVAHGKPIVIGTTGHTAEQLKAIRSASASIPVLMAANFSVGVNTLFSLARRAAELLGDSFDIEIVETHHRFKKDAPSGTANRLAEILCDTRELNRDADLVHGREGMTGERPAKQIGMHAIRAGDAVGDHTVIFGGPGERLELTHRASSRETFAVGALRAARWIIGRPPGFYRMEDVLGL